MGKSTPVVAAKVLTGVGQTPTGRIKDEQGASHNEMVMNIRPSQLLKNCRSNQHWRHQSLWTGCSHSLACHTLLPCFIRLSAPEPSMIEGADEGRASNSTEPTMYETYSTNLHHRPLLYRVSSTLCAPGRQYIDLDEYEDHELHPMTHSQHH